MLRRAILTLLILRHAKAETGEGLRDEERPLCPRGRRAATRVGELLMDRLPDRILSSSSLRTRETVEHLKRAAAYYGPIEFLEALYLASPATSLRLVREHGADARRLLLVGHNPGLEELVRDLTGERITLPTAALAECALEVEAWSEVTLETRAELVGLAYPRDDEKR
jgi:phosphohistidine phosphatase